jgi:Tfp pilus assembly protein FimV
MSRTRVRPVVHLVLAAGLAVLAMGGVSRALEPGAGPSAPASVAAHTYVVRPGDTLWSIAERLRPGEDPRPLVDAIERANGISAGELVPGQSLEIPVEG